MIRGLGIDVVAVERFEETLGRSPGLRERVFTQDEQSLGTPSLAARWAAKEALAKALGAPAGLVWRDAEVVKGDDGDPDFVIAGTVADRAAALGITRLHLSMSHDAGIASAVVVAEGD